MCMMLSSSFGGGARVWRTRSKPNRRLFGDARDQNRQRVGFRTPKPSNLEPHLRPVGFLRQIFRHLRFWPPPSPPAYAIELTWGTAPAPPAYA